MDPRYFGFLDSDPQKYANQDPYPSANINKNRKEKSFSLKSQC